MTRQEVWVEVRYRLVVVGIAALVLGAMAMSLRGSVHVSTGPATEWPGYAPEFVGTVTAWSPGQAAIGGWIENRSIDAPACPYLMAWVWSGEVQGHLTLNLGRPGPLKAGERAAWTGTVFDPTGHPAPIWKAPTKDSVFVCLWS